jgi:hypothetical protein
MCFNWGEALEHEAQINGNYLSTALGSILSMGEVCTFIEGHEV